MNVLLIPEIGFVGSAWATLVCYFSMAFSSYLLGKKHFPIPYQSSRILLYLLIMLGIYFVVYTNHLNTIISSLFLIGFLIFVYLLEKIKKPITL